MSHVGIIGAGWAGLTAAVRAIELGHQVTLWEASRTVGGRARSLAPRHVDHHTCTHDNGQHLLMSAYTETRRVMESVGVDVAKVLLDTHLDLRLPNGEGLKLPERVSAMPAWWQLAGVLSRAQGWRTADRLALAMWSFKWRKCQVDALLAVADICDELPPTVMTQLITPLCVSALNVSPDQASAALFLAVLRDTLWASPKHWRAWIPLQPLGQVFPEAALAWLRERGATIVLGERVRKLQLEPDGVRVDNKVSVDQLILAAPDLNSAALARQLPHSKAQDWANVAENMPHTAIATAYVYAEGLRLTRPMMALHTNSALDAQFVFDLGQLGRPPGHLAAVLSHAPTDGEGLKEHLQQQLRSALSDPSLCVVQLVLEKRATFTASPTVTRPGRKVCPKVWACGDAIEGPYPATLEGAVRSALNLPWQDLRDRG